MNVAETMKKVIPELNKGLDGIRFYLVPEVIENWNDKYAIVQGFYYDYPDSEYFDHDKFRRDYENKVHSFFPDCKITFYYQSQEIEVIKE